MIFFKKDRVNYFVFFEIAKVDSLAFFVFNDFTKISKMVFLVGFLVIQFPHQQN